MEYNENFDATGVEIAHHFGGGAYAKETLIPAGVELSQHKHPFDHLSILAAGDALVKCDGVAIHYQAPACITIEAKKAHSVLALTNVVWYCVHATECTDPAKIDHELTHEQD